MCILESNRYPPTIEMITNKRNLRLKENLTTRFVLGNETFITKLKGNVYDEPGIWAWKRPTKPLSTYIIKVGERTRRAEGRNDVTNEVALACDEEIQAPNSCMELATGTEQLPTRCSSSSHRRHQPITFSKTKVTSTLEFTESWSYPFFHTRKNIVQNPNPHNVRHMTDTLPIHS